MFDFWRKKKDIYVEEKIECNCRRIIDQDIITAFSVNEIEYFDKFLKKNEYNFEKVKNGNYSGFYNFMIDNISLGSCISKNNMLFKEACLSCNTCLGFRIKEKRYKSLDDYFQEKIDKEFEKRRIKKERMQLAKEICGNKI